MTHKYINVDRECSFEDIMDIPNGGYGDFSYDVIHNEIMKQFESGSVDDNGNPIAYIKTKGIDINVKFVMDRSKPWISHYEAEAVSTGRMCKEKEIDDIDYYYLTGEMRFI